MADHRGGRGPVLAFLLALSVGVLVAVIKEAGLAGSLAALAIGATTYLGVRRLRGPRVSDTRPEIAIRLGHRGFPPISDRRCEVCVNKSRGSGLEREGRACPWVSRPAAHGEPLILGRSFLGARDCIRSVMRRCRDPEKSLLDNNS